MKNLLKEFEQFAVHGNALDLAVGVVIGAAFNQVTTSLATNILTPPIGLLLGGANFTSLVIPLGGKSSIGFGIFLQACLNFIIIAFALFLIVKLVNRLTAKHEAAKAPEDSAEVQLLREIRDELKAGAPQAK